MARSRWRRPARWAIATTLVCATLYFAIGAVAGRIVLGRMEIAAAQVGAVIGAAEPPSVEVDLFARSVCITRIDLLPWGDPAGAAVRVQGRIDTVRVAGLSVFALLFSDRVAMDEFQLDITHARITMAHDSLRKTWNDQAMKEADPWSIAIGAFAVTMRSTTVVTQAGDTIATQGAGVEAIGKDLHFFVEHADLFTSLRCDLMRVSAESLTASMANGYACSVQRCLFDQERGAFEILGMHLGPKRGLEGHIATLRFETDVIEAQLDTLHIGGFDMNTAFAENTWSLGHVRLASGTVTVLRDKILPDGNDPVKPLISHLVRSFSIGSGADTITVADLFVEYRERVDRQRGYARIPFSHINATITGAVHSGVDTSSVVVDAQATVFDTASVSLHLRTVIADSTDRFEVQAGIGPLPFSAINKATGPLVDIQATAGRIDTVIYRMTADDRHATGVVRMAYHRLKMASGGRKRERTGNRIESLLLNTLVRNGNRNKDGTLREGRFAFDRRRDRSIFNYLWSGLREGVKEELLPKALTP